MAKKLIVFLAAFFLTAILRPGLSDERDLILRAQPLVKMGRRIDVRPPLADMAELFRPESILVVVEQDLAGHGLEAFPVRGIDIECLRQVDPFP